MPLPIPEPSTSALVAIGLCSLWLARGYTSQRNGLSRKAGTLFRPVASHSH